LFFGLELNPALTTTSFNAKDEVVEKARLMIDRWWEYIAKMHPIVLTVKQPKHMEQVSLHSILYGFNSFCFK
jgi:hypothetical protein